MVTNRICFTVVLLACFGVQVKMDDINNMINIQINQIRATINKMPAGEQKTFLENGLKQTTKDTNSKVTAANQKTRVKDMLVSINTALPKFQSGETTAILSGVGDLMFGIAMFAGGPYGLAFAVVGSLVSGIMGMFTPKKMKKSVKTVIEEALSQQRDTELREEAEGIRRMFGAYKQSQDRFRQYLFKSNGSIKDADVERLAPHGKIYEHMRFLGILSKRIKESTEADTERTFAFVILTAELCKLHLFNLLDVHTLIQLSGRYPVTAHMIDGVIEEVKGYCRDDIEFLRLVGVDPKQYGVLGRYYPPEQKFQTKEVDVFLDILQVPKVGVFLFTSAYTYIISPSQYSNYVICGVTRQIYSYGLTASIAWLNVIEGCLAKGKSNLWTGLTPVDGGFYEVAIGNVLIDVDDNQLSSRRDKLCVFEDNGEVEVSQQFWNKDKCSGTKLHFRLIPVQTNAYKFMIAPRDRPEEFLYMDSNPEGTIHLTSKDPEGQGYWESLPG